MGLLSSGNSVVVGESKDHRFGERRNLSDHYDGHCIYSLYESLLNQSI